MAYAKFRSDNMTGTTLGNHLAALHYQEGGTNTEIENGRVVLVGGFVDNQTDIRVATAPKANSPLSQIAVIGATEVDKTKPSNTLANYINPAGEEIRGYILTPRDIFSVTPEALDGETPTKGYYVELQDDNTKMNVVTTPTDSTTTIGKILDIEDEWVVIEVETSAI